MGRAYRWWIVRFWRTEQSAGCKLGPVTINRYYIAITPCWYVGLFNHWSPIDTGRKYL